MLIPKATNHIRFSYQCFYILHEGIVHLSHFSPEKGEGFFIELFLMGLVFVCYKSLAVLLFSIE